MKSVTLPQEINQLSTFKKKNPFLTKGLKPTSNVQSIEISITAMQLSFKGHHLRHYDSKKRPLPIHHKSFTLQTMAPFQSQQQK